MDLPVRAINRSGKRPDLMPVDVEIIAADVSDTAQAIQAGRDAAVIYQALNPPYHRWQELFPGLQASALAAARENGARFISIDNLYMYDSSGVIREDSPEVPRSKKGQVRQEMARAVLAAHQNGEVRAAILRSSDYYGPGVRDSAMGERVFGALAAGKKAQLTGNPDLPHSWAYIEDVARAAVLLGTREEALGQVWIAPHAPAVSQAEIVALAALELGFEPAYSALGVLMMRLAGLFILAAKETVEMMYEFTDPFIVASDKFQRQFNLEATPIEQGIKSTMQWYQENMPA
jgi:nucleoside-diphosphate-sugar epimerase